MTIYSYVQTAYPKWVDFFPNSLRPVARKESDPKLMPGTQMYLPPGQLQTRSFAWLIPWRVEDVLTLLTAEEKAYGEHLRAPFSRTFSGVPGGGSGWPRPENATLLTLPHHVLETEYIIPAIEMSQAEGPERE